MSTPANATASSSKLDSDATSGSPVALLVALAYDADLRRAGSDLIKRTRTAATRRRSAIVRGSASALERDPSRIGPATRRAATVELHVLILDSGKQGDEDEVITTRSTILAQFRAAGASVHLHVLPITSNRLSLTLATNTVRTTLARTLSSGQLGDALSRGLASAAFVCTPSEDSAATESRTAFIEAMASHFAASSTSPASITLYLPKHDLGLHDFDLDLPTSDVRAVRILQSAGEQFEAKSAGTKEAKRRSAEPLSTSTTSPPRPTMGAMGLVDSPKPLVLRPAPGSGPQSLSMRLSIDTGVADDGGHDVVLRVSETQTPVKDPSDGLRPLFLHPSPPKPTNTTPPPSPPPTLSSTRSPLVLLARLGLFIQLAPNASDDFDATVRAGELFANLQVATWGPEKE
ncbi:hypothetical protein RQP46_004075 [Phenoliferia psychrophenolica]